MIGDDDGLKAARRGDRESFAGLVEPHAASLRSFIGRMVGNRDDTDELSQEALARALEGIGSFRGESSFKTWLFAIPDMAMGAAQMRHIPARRAACAGTFRASSALACF